MRRRSTSASRRFFRNCIKFHGRQPINSCVHLAGKITWYDAYKNIMFILVYCNIILLKLDEKKNQSNIECIDCSLLACFRVYYDNDNNIVVNQNSCSRCDRWTVHYIPMQILYDLKVFVILSAICHIVIYSVQSGWQQTWQVFDDLEKKNYNMMISRLYKHIKFIVPTKWFGFST